MTKKLNKGLALLLATVLALSLSGALITAFAAPNEYKGYEYNEVYRDGMYEYDAYGVDALATEGLYELFNPFITYPGDWANTPQYYTLYLVCWHRDCLFDCCSNVFRVVIHNLTGQNPFVDFYLVNGVDLGDAGVPVPNPQGPIDGHPHRWELSGGGNNMPPSGNGTPVHFYFPDDNGVLKRYNFVIYHWGNTLYIGSRLLTPPPCTCHLKDIEVVKAWNFPADADVTPPDLRVRLIGTVNGEIVVQDEVTLTGPEWSHIFNVSSLYNGDRITWTVEEVLPPGWEQVDLDIIVDENGRVIKFVLINNLILIDIEVEKVWNFPVVADIIPPDLPIRLIGTANGEIVTQHEVTLTGPNWSYIFRNVPSHYNGVGIIWTVEEVLPLGWEQAPLETILREDGTFKVAKFILTNNLILIDIDVEKAWNFPADVDVTPPNLPIRLIGTINGEDDPVVELEITLTGPDWTHTFTDLPLYHNGILIEWTVEEELPLGWAKGPLDIIFEDGRVVKIVLTNVYVPDYVPLRTTREKSVVKLWDDGNNAEGLRPVQIEVHLLKNGEVYRIVFLNEANQWSHYFLNLWMYDENRVNYEYRIIEIVPYRYSEYIEYNPVTGVWRITNTLIPREGDPPTPPIPPTPPTPPGPPTPTTAPRTGDLVATLPFISAFLLSTSSVLGGMSLRKRLNK